MVIDTLYRGVKNLPRKVFGTRNDRLLKGYRRHVPPINALEPEIRGDFDERIGQRLAAENLEQHPPEEREAVKQRIRVELSEDLRERTRVLREKVLNEYKELDGWWTALDADQKLDEYYKSEYRKRNVKVIEALDRTGASHEAFAILREASRRAQAHRHFDCQLIGGRVLFEGKIAEMRTGEGKTIVCHLAAYLNVLAGKKVHIITVNDYLVKRDAEFAQPIFELVGITVGYIQAQLDPGGREGIRRQAYGCNITYGTNSEFGFDYLRDNMKTRREDQVQGSLDFVIVDEVDSILIDEARTPLIISGPAYDDVSRYPRASKVAEELVRRQNAWDRKVLATVAKFDGDDHKIPKLLDAMSILGYKERRGKVEKSRHGGQAASQKVESDGAGRSDEATKPRRHEESGGSDDVGRAMPAEPSPLAKGGVGGGSDERANASDDSMPTLGPDFLTDDQVEAIQIYENDVLKLAPTEQYRRYFIVQMERKQVGITHEGVTIAQELLDIGSLYAGQNMEWPHLIENALRAQKTYQRDKDYVVQQGQIIIVDPFTGRLMHGRQWSDGLHQAVEAKENVRVKEETQTLATITIQNFVKLYRIKGGMTGTAQTEATEFDKIYKLDVVEIPTNRPVNRNDHNDKMYRDTEQKYDAIVEEIFEVHRKGRPADPFLMAEVLQRLKPILDKHGQDTSRIDEAMRRFNAAEPGDKKTIAFMVETYDEMMGELAHGRPVLVGTTSVENSEKLSRLLERRYGIEHEVLNAKNHAREADIVAKAGQTSLPPRGGDQHPRGNVTIATNMAGRGTDIKLGPGVVYEKCKVPLTVLEGEKRSPLYPAGVTKCCINCEEYDPATNCAHCFKPKIDPRFPALGRQVCAMCTPCGLHIIGTERHEARRIDNQLRGRAGRQGDPGSSRFSLSLQDDLLKLFMSDWMLKMMERLGFTDGSSLEDKRLNKGIERAQRKVEERNFSTRKHLLEWDEPMDYQRKEFYTARQRILEERDLPALIFSTIDTSIASTLNQYLSGRYNQTCVAEWCRTNLDVNIDEDALDLDDLDSAKASIRRKAVDEANEQIRTSIGEYIDPSVPSSEWDVGGLLQWATRSFKVSMTQNQLKKMEPQEIEDALIEAAKAHYDNFDLDAIQIYLDPKYPYRALAEWARTKFNIPIEEAEIMEKPREEIASLFDERVRQAYRQREVSYPVEWCLERAFAGETGDNAAAAALVVSWANSKFRVGWKLEDVQGRTIDEVRQELTALNEEFFDDRMEKEIDEAIAGKTPGEAVRWAKQRFGRAWNQERFDRAVGATSPLAKGGLEGGLGDGSFSPDGDSERGAVGRAMPAAISAGAAATLSKGVLRSALLEQGREMLRWELTRLEQYVLLRIYDQAWKDHLLEMDHLKTAIMQRPLGGDQSHPQSQYAIEGRDLFTQMWARISGRVTDIVFKIRAAAGEAEEATGRRPAAMTFRHAESTGTGFAQANADQAAAMKAQNVEAKVETIRREAPRVGRNDPCPCGSGKKYKQCHGRGP